MNEAIIRMGFAGATRQAPDAWLIPGEDIEGWLDELTAWQIPTEPLVVYAVPRSVRDLRPRGLFVVLPSGQQPRVSGHCQGYVRRAERIYVPCESRLIPEVSDAELADWLNDSRSVLVWHPEAGLVSWAPEEARGVRHLLLPPASGTRSWDAADPGIAFARRLRSIEPIPESIPEVRVLLEAGRDDIGSNADAAEGLPRSPEEPADDWASRVLRDMAFRMVQALQKFTGTGTPEASGTAKSAAAAGGASGIGAWTQQQLQRLQESLAKLRHRSLLRLLHMLENDPDQGLQYALPFGQGGHRGVADPSPFLARRDTQFNLRDLTGGGPADAWVLPTEYYHRLRQKYLELAGREMRLGRYRRAAYIYGVLLGMLDLAASALMAGRHWRDAATLYRSRLNRPHDAVQCLERGGLWTEAIQLHEELGNWERAGEIYDQLQQPEAAARCYRVAVDRLIAQRDRLGAARLLETRLKVPDEALEQLDAGWPTGAQASVCFREAFLLLARLQRREEARKRVTRVRGMVLNEERTALVVDELARLSSDYPDPTWRTLAADTVRVLAAARLRGASMKFREQLVQAVRRLVPEDRLLVRDCSRYLESHRRPAPALKRQPVSPPRSLRAKPSARTPVWVGEFVLPPQPRSDFEAGMWSVARSGFGRLYLAGVGHLRGRDFAVVVECDWDNHHRWLGESRLWEISPKEPQFLLLAPRHDRFRDVLVAIAGDTPLPMQRASVTEAFPDAAETGTPHWLSVSAVAVARDHDGSTWVLDHRDHDFALHSFSPDGAPLASLPVGVRPSESLDEQFSLTVAARVVCAAIGARLLVFHPGGAIELTSLDHQILELSPSPPHSVPRAVASLSQGAALVWLDGTVNVLLFAERLEQPAVAILAGGWIVAADHRACQVYRSARDGLQLECEIEGLESRPIAVVPTGSVNEFALVFPKGLVRRFAMR